MQTTNVLEIIEFLKHHTTDIPFSRLIPGLGSGPLVCSWNESITESEIHIFTDKNNWCFPDDYKRFLQQHNGAVLFKQPYYGGGTELLSLDKITAIAGTLEQLPQHCYPIAWTDHRIGAICVDSVKYQQRDQSYLFFLDAMDQMEDAIPIALTFTEWLERLTICQGQEFWNWK
ncbi:SMI1/KNR4 family protein [Paenibacillus pinihumi]|uniref:SMI1/KNR4 family protein n=1 Tax=Paenibacillus pinihumi TaxID=669462 RepID=UPI000684E45A|nr:SMI1/KNR4 family protein [Paenibacillus pinihumi]